MRARLGAQRRGNAMAGEAHRASQQRTRLLERRRRGGALGETLVWEQQHDIDGRTVFQAREGAHAGVMFGIVIVVQP